MEEDFTKLISPILQLVETKIREIIRQEVKYAIHEVQNEKKPIHMYSREEVCAILHISKPTLWKITSEGFIKSTTTGRRVLYTAEAINDYLEYGKVKQDFSHRERRIGNAQSQKHTYIMLDESTNYYKIGISNSPVFREGTLRAEKPSIKLLYVCDFNIEKVLHKIYKEYRVRGEWFDLSKKQIQEIVDAYKFKEYAEK